MSIALGINIAILEEGRVLLTQREDFEVWCLPGGGVDVGESLADAARREAREETGLEVELLWLVGFYSRPNWHTEGSHIAVLAARRTGGELRLQASEVLQAQYFGPDELPGPLLFGQRQRILDVFAGVTGAVWTQEEVWPLEPEISREKLYGLRDASGLSRQDFYRHVFDSLDVGKQKLEVSPCSHHE